MSDDDTTIRFSMIELGAPKLVAQGELAIATEPDDISRFKKKREDDYQALRERLLFLEGMYATKLRHQVPTTMVEAEEKHGYKCGFHPNVIVSATTPVVRCQVCGEALDPIDVLRQFSKHERNFAHMLEHFRNEKDQLKLEIEGLKRERHNLRTQIRRRNKVDTGNPA